MKFLLFLALVAIVWWLWNKRSHATTAEPAMKPVEEMVRCAHCGVYLPEAESIVADGRRYCSEAHRLAGSDPA
ncbi:MAG: PP0621 family protein [Betaproteobacteria bacterium]